MRFVNQLFAIAFATIVSVNICKAQDTKTFYLCSNTSFTLRPQVTTFTEYEWNEINGSSNPVSSLQDLGATSPTISGTSYTTTKYTLKVKNGTTGCWSEPDTFTVYTLPPISASITGAASGYCANNSIADTLQASVGSLTLPAGVTADVYEWVSNSVTLGTGSTLALTTGTTAGTTNYSLKVSYHLPSTIGGSKLSSCNGTASASIIVVNAPTTPSISVF